MKSVVPLRRPAKQKEVCEDKNANNTLRVANDSWGGRKVLMRSDIVDHECRMLDFTGRYMQR